MMRSFAVTLLLFPLLLLAAPQDTLSPKKVLRQARPSYLKIGTGLGRALLRDFATSPLFYQGFAGNFLLGRTKFSDKRESSVSLFASFGNYTAKVEKTPVTSSTVGTLSLNYSQLYGIDKWRQEKWYFQVGGALAITGNIRDNASLLNNSLGGEMVSTLFALGKVTRDVSRINTKKKKVLFCKYTLHPRRRSLSLQLQLPVMNTTLRNGYVYAGQSALLNRPEALDGYVFKVFSGYRFGSEIQYTIYLNNKNALQLSYYWDAYKTGGNLDRFEMVNHQLTLSLLFNIK